MNIPYLVRFKLEATSNYSYKIKATIYVYLRTTNPKIAFPNIVVEDDRG